MLEGFENVCTGNVCMYVNTNVCTGNFSKTESQRPIENVRLLFSGFCRIFNCIL